MGREREPVQALVLNFAEVDGGTTAATAALALGHAVGNRHWDLAIEGTRAYLLVTGERERMDTEVRPHLPTGVTVGSKSVSPALFDGATPDHDHSHGPDGHHHGSDGHGHSHGADHAVRSLDPDGGDES